VLKRVDSKSAILLDDELLYFPSYTTKIQPKILAIVTLKKRGHSIVEKKHQKRVFSVKKYEIIDKNCQIENKIDKYDEQRASTNDVMIV
jgi:hypothetical protein